MASRDQPPLNPSTSDRKSSHARMRSQSSHVAIDDSDDDSRRIPPSTRSETRSETKGVKPSVRNETDQTNNVNTKEASVRFDIPLLEDNPDKSPSHHNRQGSSSTQQYHSHSTLDALTQSKEGVSFTPSPEIMFLIREHAKTLANLSCISKRLEQLEAKVCDIQRTVTESSAGKSMTASSSSPGGIMVTSSGNEVKVGSSGHNNHILSDDSGGEYSRTTNGTTADEDELISLLDQIVKHSQQIRETQSQQAMQQHVLVNSIRVPPQTARDHHLNMHQDRSVGETVANQGQVMPSSSSAQYGQVLHHHRPAYPPLGAVSYPAGYQGRQQQQYQSPTHMSSYTMTNSNGYQNRPYSGMPYSSYPGSPEAFHHWVPPLGYHFTQPGHPMIPSQAMDFSPLMPQLSAQMSHMHLAGPSVSLDFLIRKTLC